MKQKIATSIRQSKKLMKLGLKRKTADMFWRHCNLDNHDYLITIDKYEKMYSANIPAWSINALMKLMPDGFKIEKYSDRYDALLKEMPYSTGWQKTIIDALVECTIYLLEHNYIEHD